MGHRHGIRRRERNRGRREGARRLTVALAGNANVGKSVIFNELTGLHQHVGNWPGKTVERAEGTLSFRGYTINIVDLPGIYSLSTYSIEELVSREYIAVEQPDVLVNVVDASALERNLFFTLQLIDLEPRMIIALNQVDLAEKKGVRVDEGRLSKLLGVPVVPTVAVKSVGLQSLMEMAIQASERAPVDASSLELGPEVEGKIMELMGDLGDLETPYPRRWIAIKLLEGDEEIERIVYGRNPDLAERVQELNRDIEALHGHDAASAIASERYALAHRLALEASEFMAPETTLQGRALDLVSHPLLGYVFMATVMLATFYAIFALGDYMTGLLDAAFGRLREAYMGVLGSGAVSTFLWDGVVEGFLGGIGIALPYIVPFYLVLSVLEDSGYLARVAFLMDSAMHKIGLHGKGFIPLMLGFGCNVPACLGCRIMETERERLICAFVASLIPCAARSIVIMGLVATYVGFRWALLLYAIDFLLIFVLGRIAFKAVPGEPVGLILEMPPYRRPSLKVTSQRTWFRLKDFVYEAFPLMVAGNMVIILADIAGVLDLVQGWMSPVTVLWLGLPAASGVVLIFGVLRKELTLILLASLMGTTDFSAILSPVQMFVFAFVVMIYIPCIATIAVLAKEFGYRRAAIITVIEVLLAVVLGGFLFRALMFLGLG
ncbi:MAG: ferrous iron transport protein B [Candidatus Bathyarchaeota archaeon]|nr:MAG: ferrous iron transport protein B [Candidatus Bathyarchaeota archaeon]